MSSNGKRPVIGIVPLVDYPRESYWMLPGYMNGLIEAGAAPLMLPLTEDPEMLEQLLSLCDGLLLTGGQDVCPVLYGDKEKPWCGECSPERDRMELVLLDLALARDMAVFGICRGLQFLNAALGGTLYQDIMTERVPGGHSHQCIEPPYNTPAHEVFVMKDTPLWELFRDQAKPYQKENADGAGEAIVLGVNSLHHQAIKDLSPKLQIMAYSDDALVESVWHPGKSFVWAVQWHPEFLYKVDENSRRLFRAFVEAAGKTAGTR